MDTLRELQLAMRASDEETHARHCGGDLFHRTAQRQRCGKTGPLIIICIDGVVSEMALSEQQWIGNQARTIGVDTAEMRLDRRTWEELRDGHRHTRVH